MLVVLLISAMALPIKEVSINGGRVPIQFSYERPQGTIVACVGVEGGVVVGYKECVVGFYDFTVGEIQKFHVECPFGYPSRLSLVDVAVDKKGNMLVCTLCKRCVHNAYERLVRFYDLDSYFAGGECLAQLRFDSFPFHPVLRDIHNLAGGCVTVISRECVIDIRLSGDRQSATETARRERVGRVRRVMTDHMTEVTLVNNVTPADQYHYVVIGDGLSYRDFPGHVQHAVLVEGTTIAFIMQNGDDFYASVYHFAKQKVITSLEIPRVTEYRGLCVAPGPELWAACADGFVVVDLRGVDLTGSD